MNITWSDWEGSSASQSAGFSIGTSPKCCVYVDDVYVGILEESENGYYFQGRDANDFWGLNQRKRHTARKQVEKILRVNLLPYAIERWRKEDEDKNRYIIRGQ